MPVLWIDIVFGVLVACYCVYLLFTGTSVVMGTAPERGFLYASATIAAALVGIVVVFTVTIILWDYGIAPEYNADRSRLVVQANFRIGPTDSVDDDGSRLSGVRRERQSQTGRSRLGHAPRECRVKGIV